MLRAGVFRDFVKYSSLNVLGMMALSCYILADTFFVAKGLGANGLTALNLAIPIYSFIYGTSLMIGIGSGTKYSILRSQYNEEAANQAFTSAIKLTAGFALVFFLLGAFASESIVTLLGADQTVFAMTQTYLQVILLFAPMFMLNNVLLCFVRNDGSPQLTMLAMMAGSLANVLLDYVFIFPLNMGIFGAVLATGFAPIISMLVLSNFFIKKRNNFHFIKAKLSGKWVVSIFSSGLPSLIIEVSAGIVIIVFNIIILNLNGNIGVAAYGVIANLSLVIMAIYTGIAQGIQPILSSNHGAKNHENVRLILRYALTTVFVMSGFIYAGVYFGASQIVGIFNSENNALLQEIATTGLKYYFTACLFAGFNIIISIYFTSTEFPLPAHVISLLRGFIVIIPMTFFLSDIAGMIGVWSAFPLTELVVSVLGVFFYFSNKKNKIRVR